MKITQDHRFNGATRRHAPLIALAWVALWCAACERGDDKVAAPDETAAVASKPIAVEVAPVATSEFTQTLVFPGTAEPIDERRVASEVSGRVLAAPFEEGARVEKGDLLLRVDARSTGAQIDVIQSQISSSKREYGRIKQLAAEGLATPQQLDQAAAQLEQAELSLKQARVGQGMATVRAPVSGTIATKYVDRGEFASPGAPVADIVDMSTVELHATVPESAISFVSEGIDVSVYFPSVDRTVKGKVVRRGVRVVQPTQTFPIEIHVPNEDGVLLAGMRAEVRIPKSTIEGAVVVPRDAILEGVTQREAMVLGAREGGELAKAEMRIVEFGETRGNEAVITKGLRAGDMLIVKGHRNIVDGSLVRVLGTRALDTHDEDTSKEAAPAGSDESQDAEPPVEGGAGGE